jgi:RhoGEF domain
VNTTSNFDNSVQRIKQWVIDRPGTATGSSPLSPSLASQPAAGIGASNMASDPSGGPQLTSSQKKRIKNYLKRCRLNPRHSQLNLEGYLLLPVQRIPRYRLLVRSINTPFWEQTLITLQLEELARSTTPAEGYVDPLDQALDEISSLATNMNEGKRESESRSKLVQWQSRIKGRFPSPLVQPHR